MSSRSETGTDATPLAGLPTVPALDCPACASTGAHELFRGRDRLHGVPGSYRYVRCRECHTVYQSPRIADAALPRAYTGEYYTHEPPDPLPDAACFLPAPQVREADLARRGREPDHRGAEELVTGAEDPAAHVREPDPPNGSPRSLQERIRREIIRMVAPPSPDAGEESKRGASWSRASVSRNLSGTLLARSRFLRERAFGDQVMDELLPRRNPPGRALDVGCGSGRLLGRLARVGWEVEGVEWDPEAARIAQEATGFRVHVGGAGTLPSSLGTYHLLVMVHVLEHLARPVDGLVNLRELLAPGGRIVVIYPNPESLLRRRFSGDWFPWEVPRHLSLLPVRALRMAGRRAGLELRQVRTLARWADSTAWKSRALRDGRHPEPPTPEPSDRVWRHFETALVRLGAPLGEEIVGVFERAGSAH